MVQLACDVKLGDGRVAIVAPGSGDVRVSNVFVCWLTGKVHRCSELCRRNSSGVCDVTGYRYTLTMLPQTLSTDTPVARRSVALMHRRGATVGNDVVRRTTRDIVRYLCFSDTRYAYATRLLSSARGKTRRWVIRQLREKSPVDSADISLFYANTVFAARSSTQPFRMPLATRQRLLAAVSESVHRLHAALGAEVVSALSSTRVFCLASVYLMRLGLRSSSSGEAMVPRVPVLSAILPNAHLLSTVR